MENDVRRETEALRNIKARWAAPFSYYKPSILERPCGNGGGILDAIEWLQCSALCWCSLNHHEEDYDRQLEKLKEITEDALSRFREFRTVNHDYGLIPRGIHEQVTGGWRRIYDSSRLDLREPPNVTVVRGVGVSVLYPLRDSHLAAIASLVCCVRCINDLVRILEFWRSMLRSLPAGKGAKYLKQFESSPCAGEWEDALLRRRSYPENLRYETETRRDAFGWIERAEVWLMHGEQLETMREKVEDAAQRAATEARQSEQQKGREEKKNASEVAARNRVAKANERAKKIKELASRFQSEGVPKREINKRIAQALGENAPSVQRIGGIRKKSLTQK